MENQPANGSRRVLLIVTGGISAYKSGDIVRECMRQGAAVQVVMTRAAREFVQPLTFEALSNRPVATEMFPDRTERFLGRIDGSIDHIQLARWCEVVAVAPATADFIAKASCGIADELALGILLALERGIPVVWFPAMNTQMWTHPLTQRNVERLRSLPGGWQRFVEPVEKKLACGEHGIGGLPEPADAARRILSEVQAAAAH